MRDGALRHPSVSQSQGTTRALGSWGPHNPADQNTAGFANMCGFPSAFQYRGATIQRADRNVRQFHHPIPEPNATRRVPQGAVDQS